MKKLYVLFGVYVVLCIAMVGGDAQSAFAQPGKLHVLDFKEAKDLRDFFSYKGDGSIIISGHRGGYEVGYPENSVEGFANVLMQMPAFFEIDPRLTKDSVAVLLHDATLDRTTTGKGLLSDYTWEELQSIYLKDHSGKVTNCKIPRLEDVIVWSKGKTIINLDKKDVPLAMVADLIKKHHAERNVMLTVHTGAQARYYYDRFPDIMMSAFVRNAKEYEDMEISGVPWSHIIAYVGHTIDDTNRAICEKLHKKGARCMISVAPTHDRLQTSGERARKYLEEIEKKPDIIESDIPTEVWKVLLSH